MTSRESSLSLEEKARLLSGRDFWSTAEGQGLRSLTLVDGPHGVRRQDGDADNLGLNASVPAVCFPTGAALASSWDRDLIAEVGVALGKEARSLGVDVLLGPAINIKRSPLGGRGFEYLSEDPHLTAELAIAYVNAVQSTGVGTSVKHFAVNNQETDRMQVSAVVDDRALREIYLRAFERVVKEADPTSVMSAYNAINGVFCSENHWLLTEVLREEWGFAGLVVSDWGAIKDRVEALVAGLDLEMPGGDGDGPRRIVEAVTEGGLDEAVVDRAVTRLRALSERTTPRSPVVVDGDAHHALARRAAAQSMVLLRNEDEVLPLKSGTSIAVIGAFAVEPPFQGGGSSRVTPTRVDSPLDELRVVFGEDRTTYAPGYDLISSEDPDPALVAEAVALASSADVAIVMVGLPEKAQSEGFDREHLDMPIAHREILEAVSKAASRTVVVLMNGGVVTLEPWHDSVDAIVEAWSAGQAVGGALADVLSGAVNPSARLAESIPLSLQSTPSFLTFPGERGEVRYGESIYVGYRYYSTANVEVRYPFGHGLSYTTFECKEFDARVSGPDSVEVSVTVTNVGTREGAEVVQIYVAPPEVGTIRRPRRELAAFEKVNLLPGEHVSVEFELDRRSFAHWDVTNKGWSVLPGQYRLELGRSAAEVIESRCVDLDGDTQVHGPLSLDSTVGEWFGHPVVGPALMEAMLAAAGPEQLAAADQAADGLRMVESMPMRQFRNFPGVAMPDSAIESLIALSETHS